MKTKIVLAICFLALVAMAAGSAQAGLNIRADIPFQFVVKGTTLPAGQYEFVRRDYDQAIEVVPATKGPSTIALVITRLGQKIHTTPKDDHIVFDKVGNTYFLSELWISGEEGFVLYITKEKHEHRTINIPS